MKKLEQKKEILALSIFVLAVFCVVYYLVLMKPPLSRLRTFLPQVARIKNEVASAREDIARIGQLKKKVADLRAGVDYYQNQLPGKKEIPSLLENLSQIAKESNVKLLGIQPQPSPDRGEEFTVYQEVPIAINAECGYHQLGLFINKLENSARFMKVADIKITGGAKNPRIHNVKLVISTFVLVE